METLAIINATRVNEFATQPFAGGPSAFERVLSRAREAAGDGILVLAGAGKLPDSGTAFSRKPVWSMHGVMTEISSFIALHVDVEAVLYYQADTPFVDADLTETLLELHRRYRAEYTFADGYPPGFAPEILAARVLPNLVELAARHDAPAERDGLFAVIQKDINSYDIETHLSPVDLRGYRFSPVCDTKRNFMGAERLWNLGARGAEDVTRILPAHPELLRTVPAFMWVQISDACPQSCAYCPYPLMVGDPRKLTSSMPVKRFETLMLEAEKLCDDLVVDVSLWGEPSGHPDFNQIVEAVLSRPRFTLLVETSGIGWAPGVAESIAVLAGDRVQWIVSLDDIDIEAYRLLRGQGMDEAHAFAERMVRQFPGVVHVQAVRMKDNESRLEEFYRTWKKQGAKVIIQKYDSFAACLPDRTVADLSPLDRLPCRHLARDIAVLLDGSIPTCKHMLHALDSGTLEYEAILGNVFKDGLETVWNAMGAWYGRHLKSDLPIPCGRCDEYHTFNA